MLKAFLSMQMCIRDSYYVFNDETLNEIISIKPQTIDELLTVKGFGQKKCEWYGNDILQIIRSL